MGAAVAGGKHTLVILNPGHFHAALTLRAPLPGIEQDIHVFAEDGPDVDNFVSLVHAFNDRALDPTRWTLCVYRGADYLEKLLARRPGEVVIVAGRNDEKLPLIHLLHAQGFSVLADKPWLIDSAQLGLVKEVLAAAPLAMDIMTERHEIANRLQKALMRDPAVFGELRRDDGQPVIAIRSVHHLCKNVNGQRLQRPAWYFDPVAQGEGITDVATHLVDLAHWLTGSEEGFDFDRDVDDLSASQWPSVIPRELFARITGLQDFPAFLHDRVAGDALHYLCNALISYRLRGIAVRIETLWGLEEPEGGGDLHRCVVRGTRSELIVDQGPQTQFQTVLSVNPVESGPAFARTLEGAVAGMQNDFPGLGVEPLGAGFQLRIPRTLRTTHEQHFAMVLQNFLSFVTQGEWPANIGPDIHAKYTLLARALELSRNQRTPD